MKLAQIWRYPVKSMGGERLASARIEKRGLPGDRGWAIKHEKHRGAGTAKKVPGLLGFSARYAEQPSTERVPAAEVTFPDGTTLRTDAAEFAGRLGSSLGAAVELHAKRVHSLPLFPSTALFINPPTAEFFDAFPIHLLTTASLRSLAAARPESSWDVRRFRPNLVIEADGEGFPELRWKGKLRVGGAVLNLKWQTGRCVMTTLAQGGLGKDPEILKTIVKAADNKVGRYATVAEPGPIAVGDAVEVLP